MRPPNAEAQLSAELSSEIGRQITILEKAHGGIVSEVYSADCDGAKAFVKLNPRKDLFPVQAALSDELRRRGIPLPEVLAHKELPSLSKSVLVEAAVLGEPLEVIPAERRAALYREAGQLLRGVHELKVDGFGPLIFENGALSGTYYSWKEYVLASEDDDYSYLVEHGFVFPETRERIVTTIRDLSEVSLDRASVIHGDMQGAHVFSDGVNITGLIDFGNAKAGDPRLDLAIARVFLDDVEWGSLKEGYGPAAEDPVVNHVRHCDGSKETHAKASGGEIRTRYRFGSGNPE